MVTCGSGDNTFLSVFFSARNYYQKKQAEIAYQQTLEAFSLLAQNYQKATAPAVYLNEFEQAKAKIYKPKKNRNYEKNSINSPFISQHECWF